MSHKKEDSTSLTLHLFKVVTDFNEIDADQTKALIYSEAFATFCCSKLFNYVFK